MTRMTVVRLRAALAVLAGLVVLGIASPASAHEGREVGEYEMIVGFGDEPAYAGFLNSVQLILLHHDTSEPVVDLGDGLQVEVQFGDQSMPLTIEPNFEVGEFGEPGDYRAHFIPNRSGSYTFHFTGTIGDQEVDESFTSGPETFGDVLDTSAAQFPAKDPSVAEVSDRLQQEVPRLTDEIDATKDDASSARTVGMLGIGVGAIGVLVAILALLAARRRKAA